MTNPTDSVHPFNETNESNSVSIGLTKREYFAAIAMQGYISSYAGLQSIPSPEDAANISVKMSDALIKELNR